MTKGKNIYQLSNIKQSYGNFTLKIPDFSITAGESIGLSGPNGSGKSTLLRLLALLAREELTVAELSSITRLAQPRVSTHLAKLKEAGLARDRRAGVSAYYRFSDEGLDGAAGALWRTLSNDADDPLLRATLTLCVVTILQALALALWLAWREPGELARVIAARRTAVWMGLTGMAGSLCWFTAFTLQNAALVFAVGQVEVIFSLIAAVLVFGERITKREGAGIALVTLSVVAVVLLR